VLVIAVGNVFRGDDGAGPQVAARVRTLDLPRVTVVDALGDVGLIDLWTGHDHVILLDAVRSGAAPGTVIRRDLLAAPLPREWFHLSSHQLGIADAVELARTMGRLPPRLVFIGIEGEAFESGVGLSPRVTAALDDAARLVERETQV
jgi:hydrogenase maturation protease